MSFSLIMTNCGHNIIQIETNIRIEEEKQKYQIKKQLELQGLELLQRRHQLGKY